jgi:hypothetical protein
MVILCLLELSSPLSRDGVKGLRPDEPSATVAAQQLVA